MAEPAKRANRKGEDRRQAILDAAIELWSARGWRGTGLIAVAERAGVTHAGLLHHFGSKANLLLAVIAERERRSATNLDAALNANGLDLVRRLPELARSSEAHPGLPQLLLVLMAENLDTEGPGHAYFVARQRRIRRRIAKALRDARDNREIRRDVDPDAKAAEVVAFLDGAHLQWLLDPAGASLHGLLESYAETLVRDLTRKD